MATAINWPYAQPWMNIKTVYFFANAQWKMHSSAGGKTTLCVKCSICSFNRKWKQRNDTNKRIVSFLMREYIWSVARGNNCIYLLCCRCEYQIVAPLNQASISWLTTCLAELFAKWICTVNNRNPIREKRVRVNVPLLRKHWESSKKFYSGFLSWALFSGNYEIWIHPSPKWIKYAKISKNRIEEKRN